MSPTYNYKQQALCYERYPYEIFYNISYYLTSRQKGICQAVCRSWQRLFTPSQYRYIQLRGRRQFNDFYSSLLFGTFGHHIRRLSLDDIYMSTEELESLPDLCPNLVEFSFNRKSIDDDSLLTTQNHNSNVKPFFRWKHLRRLTELQDLTVTNYLLTSPTTSLSSLTHLCLRFNNEESKARFLSNLHNATKLISLSLDSITLSLTEIETIHAACPYLQKLRLMNANLVPISDTSGEKRGVASMNLEPAKFMKTFEFQNSQGLYQNYEWLYFISIKYVSLVSLELWCKFSVSSFSTQGFFITEDLEERYYALAQIGMACLQLKSLKMFNVPMNHLFFEALDCAGAKLDSVALGDMTDNTIHILQSLSESKQNVSDLTLWGWPSLCIQGIMEETISIIGRCSDRLTSFTFSMRFSGIRNSPVALDTILSNCKKIKRLKLDNVQAILTTPNVKNTQDTLINDGSVFLRPQLEHIMFENGSFRNEIFDYLSVCCPQLSKLHIQSCALIGNFREMEVKIKMPNHNFESISINHLRPPSFYYHQKRASDIRLFDIMQGDEKKAGWNHTFELTDYESFVPSLSFSYEQKPMEYNRPTKYLTRNSKYNEESNTPFVSIRCLSLTELNIGGFWVV